MKTRLPSVLVVAALSAPALAEEPKRLQPDAPIACEHCDEWNARCEPYRVFGNTYYVGVEGLSAVLITSDQGHILIDGALPQSAQRIDESIRSLGFRLQDVRLILVSHEHYDHVGGIAALRRASGAPVAASAPAARALERGEPLPEDPQFGFGKESTGYPPVAPVRIVSDGETLEVGTLSVTAHRTPGHTPGSTTWTWRSCEGARCLDVVYADSLNAVSAPGFRFGAVPGRVEAFRKSIATVRALPCDILLSVHPGFASLGEKRRLRALGARPTDPFLDPAACRAYADKAELALEQRLTTQEEDR
jgi:metallo-beta-lactamase class B